MKKHRGALILVIVASFMVMVSFLVQAQDGGFTETFEDPALPGWERSQTAEVLDGVLRIDLDGFARHDGSWDDLQLGVRARLDGEGLLAISYRVSETGEYAVHINRKEITLLRSGEPIAGELIEPLPPGEWFTLALYSMAEHQEILLNGAIVLVTSDPEPLSSGGVALAVYGEAQGTFDDLTIFPLGENPAPEALGEEPPESGEPTLESSPAVPEPISEPPSSSGLTWVRTGGPPGGIGYDIRYKFDAPSTWFVTDNFAGVHMSTDDGLTWTPSNEGIPGQLGPTGDWRPVFSLTIDPHNSETIWAGTDKTGHIYKSIDGGQTWTQKDQGVLQMTDEYDALSFRGFTVDPKDSNVIYAMGETADTPGGGALVWGTAIGGVVYKTSNGGENWELIWDGGIPSSLARYMWINPQDTNILYVSTGIFDRGAVNEGLESEPNPYGGLGILKSTDGGSTWRVLNEANGLNFYYINSLFMHPDNPDVLLAGAAKLETEGYQEYLTENNLTTLMGVYRTTDGGESWTQVLAVGGGYNAVEICPSDSNIAYAASGSRVDRSEDAGVTWIQVAGEGGNGWGPPGVLAGTPIDLQCDPLDPDRIFSNNYLGGNFLSEDGGKTWINASDGYTGAQITSVAVDPHNPAQIYVAGRNGIWSSGDSGNTWDGMRYPPPGQRVWGGEWGGIAIDPSDANHLLASEEIIWESFEGGASWEVRQTPALALGSAIVFAPSDTNIVYTGMVDPICLLNAEAPCQPGYGVYVSRDGGSNWDFANDANIADLIAIDLAVDPVDSQVVFVATMRGLFKTTNGGTSWTEVNGLPTDSRIGAITIHPQDSQNLLTGVEAHGLYISSDGGGTWHQVAAGLQPNSSIRDILYDPSDPQVVYLSDLLSGIYRSTDGGQTWTQINEGLTNRSTTGLGISTDGLHLYTATSGGGVFRLDLDGRPPISVDRPPSSEQPAEDWDEGDAITEDKIQPTQSETATTVNRSNLFVGIGIGIGLSVIVGIVFTMFRRRRT